MYRGEKIRGKNKLTRLIDQEAADWLQGRCNPNSGTQGPARAQLVSGVLSSPSALVQGGECLVGNPCDQPRGGPTSAVSALQVLGGKKENASGTRQLIQLGNLRVSQSLPLAAAMQKLKDKSQPEGGEKHHPRIPGAGGSGDREVGTVVTGQLANPETELRTAGAQILGK